MKKILAKKSLSQNFLHDKHVINKIVELVPNKENTILLEIGPGMGAITEQLVQFDKPLITVELDQRIIPVLTKKFAQNNNFTLIHEDILKLDLNKITKPASSFIVLGNLPYHISTAIMFHLFNFASCISTMIFMMQKEMVQRICSSPNSKQYGRLSIMTQYYSKAHQSFIISPKSFSPVPKVDSQMVILEPYKTKPIAANNQNLFAELVKEAFSYRRKTLKNSLKKKFDTSLLEQKFDLGKRPENFTVAEFVEIANMLSL